MEYIISLTMFEGSAKIKEPCHDICRHFCPCGADEVAAASDEVLQDSRLYLSPDTASSQPAWQRMHIKLAQACLLLAQR
jgi:hypothetical protein